jgi:hypothetical protein
MNPGDRVTQSDPRHWVPIIVAFYDMNGLQWDYSLIPPPHGYVSEAGFLFCLNTKREEKTYIFAHSPLRSDLQV